MAKTNNKNGRKLITQQSVDQVIKSICDIMRRGNCAGALQYVPELTWILFLRILDEREQKEQEEYDAVGISFTPSIESPYRWQDWASPEGQKRKELEETGTLGTFFSFVNGYTDANGNMTGLLPYLKNLKNVPNAMPRQKVISEIMTSVEQGCSTLFNTFIMQNISEIDTIIKKFRSDIGYFICS